MDVYFHKNVRLQEKLYFDPIQELFTIHTPQLNFQYLFRGKKEICNLEVKGFIFRVIPR